MFVVISCRVEFDVIFYFRIKLEQIEYTIDKIPIFAFWIIINLNRKNYVCQPSLSKFTFDA